VRLTDGEPTDAIMWVRTTGAGSSESVENAVRQATRGQDLMVMGSAEGRNEFTDLMHRTVFTICLVMAAALIIALSGLANTTDVSVLERTREIGLLRATGTDRSQVRRLIVIEASLLALIGGVLGVVIGTALGAAGTLAVLSDGGISVFIPYLPLAGVLAVTLPALAVAELLRYAVRRFLPPNLFLYIFINGFFCAAAGMMATGAAITALLSQSTVFAAVDLWQQAFPVFFLISWGEAFLTGMFTAIFVALKPQFLLTFDDDFYLSRQNNIWPSES